MNQQMKQHIENYMKKLVLKDELFEIQEYLKILNENDEQMFLLFMLNMNMMIGKKKNYLIVKDIGIN